MNKSEPSPKENLALTANIRKGRRIPSKKNKG